MKKNKGISLIVLVITIIVVIILAGAVILSLADNNPINKANEAKFKSNVASYNSELALAISNKYLQTNSFVSNTFNAGVWDGTTEHIAGTIKEYIPSITAADGAKFSIKNGNLVYTGSNLSEKNSCSELNILSVSSSSFLTSISVSVGTLDPAFNKNNLIYNVFVDNTTNNISLTPTAEDPAAIIKVNGIVTLSGAASQSINLPTTNTQINIVVTATSGNSTTYTINVIKRADATLSGLTIRAGLYSFLIDPPFQAKTFDYSITAGTKTSANFTPTVSDASATIKINNIQCTSGQATSIPISVGAVIVITVTASDGLTVNNYRITVM